jgi:hypothetical protein
MDWKELIDKTDTLTLLAILKDHDLDIFYKVVYKILKTCPEKILNNKYSTSQKLDALEKMKDHFTETEEYEKCAKIKQIIDGIKEDIILSNNK